MLNRRSFLATAAAALPLGALVRRAHAAAVSQLQADPRTLAALGEVVLPSAMGAGAMRAEVDAFRQWITGYRPGAEVTHAYGGSRLRFSGPTPATRWTQQLADLDARAKSQHGASFADLSTSHRSALVRETLAKERLDRIPAVADANHVAVALIAHYYDSPAATDLCYEAQIGKTMCRPLDQSSRKPLPLARS